MKVTNDITKVSVESDIEKLTKSSLMQIYSRLKMAFKTKEIGTLSRYDINHSPWVLFDQFDDDKPLIKRWRFIRFYKKLTHDVDNYRFIIAFYNAYLFSYPYKEKYIAEVQNHIKALLVDSQNIKVSRLSVELLQRNTLDDNAHIVMIEHIVHTSNIEQVLTSRGLLGGLSTSKFTLAVLSEYLNNFKSHINTSSFSQKINIIVNLVEFSELDGKLRYPEFRIEIANAILTFLHHIQIEPTVKDTLKTFFLTHYGDPRIELAGWHGVREEFFAVG